MLGTAFFIISQLANCHDSQVARHSTRSLGRDARRCSRQIGFQGELECVADELAERLGIAAQIDGERGDAAHESAVYTALSRLLKKAEVLIRNAEHGRFPDHTDYEKSGKTRELPSALVRLRIKQPSPSPEQMSVSEPILI